jgi:5'-nucleotidase
MTGAQLRGYLERVVNGKSIGDHVSGVTIGYNPALPAGKRIVSITFPAGRTLADGATYDVIVSDFLATGGDGMGPPEGATATPLGIVDLDALVSYMRSLPSPISAPAEARIFIAQ